MCTYYKNVHQNSISFLSPVKEMKMKRSCGLPYQDVSNGCLDNVFAKWCYCDTDNCNDTSEDDLAEATTKT